MNFQHKQKVSDLIQVKNIHIQLQAANEYQPKLFVIFSDVLTDFINKPDVINDCCSENSHISTHQ